MLTIALIGGGRFMIRVVSETAAARRRDGGVLARATGALAPTLIVGAGDAGALVALRCTVIEMFALPGLRSPAEGTET